MSRPHCTLLLIRHGETEWNTQARIQGHIDIPLSERGRRHARQLAVHLRGQTIAALYASDLARARQTAQPLAESHGLALIEDTRLRERAFGLFEGRTWEESQKRWPEEFAILNLRSPESAAPGGESYVQLRARVMHCLNEIALRHESTCVAIVTHGGVLDVVYRAAYAIPWETPRSHQLPNASINRATVRAAETPSGAPEFVIQSWAEAGHLDDTLDELP